MRPAPIARSSRGIAVLCIDNDRAILDGMERCSAAGAAGCSRRQIFAAAVAPSAEIEGSA